MNFPCIEVKGLPTTSRSLEATATIDRRCYFKKKTDTVDQRIRLSIFKRDCRAIEMSPDEAIEFFKKGIQFANDMKAGKYAPAH